MLGVFVGSSSLIIDGLDVAIIVPLYAINIDETECKVLDELVYLVDSNNLCYISLTFIQHTCTTPKTPLKKPCITSHTPLKHLCNIPWKP